MSSILTFIAQGFAIAFTPKAMILMAIGVILGIIFGALPGLSATTGMALLLPLVFGMDVNLALLMLGGIYAGALYGGSISAVLLGIPGTASALPTTWDGFPLSKKGRASEGLLAGLYGSSIGGILSAGVLMFLTPVIASYAIHFGAPECMLLAIWGISMVSGVMGGDVIKGLFMAALGLLVGMVGSCNAAIGYRFTFGNYHLYNGFHIVPLVLGMLAFPRVYDMLESFADDKPYFQPQSTRQFFLRPKQILKRWFLILRSAVIGILVGIAPAAGPTIAAMMSYDAAKKSSKHPETFGEGNVDGVWASETANNGATGGSLVFAFALGIPGSPAAAVLMSALTMRGIQPGPLLMSSPDTTQLVYTFFAGFLIVNFLVWIFGHGFVQFGKYVLKMSTKLLAPAIVVLCVIGAFSDSKMFGVTSMLIISIVGYFLVKMKFPIAPFLLGQILSNMFESNFWTAYEMTGGKLYLIFTRPLSIILTFLIIATFAIGPISKAIKKKKAVAASSEKPADEQEKNL